MFIKEVIAQTTTPASTAPSGFAGSLMQFAPILLIVLFMYFLVMRPQMKRQKEQQKMLANLAKGDEVITIGGILGRITKVNDTYVNLEVGNSEIKCQKSAITHILPKGSIKDIE